jgi:hypothetical protein
MSWCKIIFFEKNWIAFIVLRAKIDLLAGKENQTKQETKQNNVVISSSGQKATKEQNVLFVNKEEVWVMIRGIQIEIVSLKYKRFSLKKEMVVKKSL